MNAAAAHLALNNVPPIANVIAICLALAGVAARSAPVVRASLVILVTASVLSIPTYMTGTRAQRILRKIESVNVPAIEPQQEAALASIVLFMIQGAGAVVAALRARAGHV